MENCIINTLKQLLPYEEILTLPRNIHSDLIEKRTIRSDCERTRATVLSREEKALLESLLTVYCHNQKIKYKQGMNELLAPFLLLVRDGLSLNEAYTLFSVFIDKMLPTMFRDDSFRPLQGLFTIFQLLLRYHYPDIFNLLINSDVPPNCYAAPWFITVFASKINEIEIVFKLWEEIIKENDELFTCYIAVGILRYFNNELAGCDPASLPKKISGLRLSSVDEIFAISQIAREIKTSMPYCFHQKLMRYNIFRLDTIDSIISTLSHEICLSMNPRYIMQRVLPDKQLCRKCTGVKCFCFPDVYEIPIIIIDCRSQEEFSEGHLDGSDCVNAENYENINSLKLGILEKYAMNKGQFHFCLLGKSGLKIEEPEIEFEENGPQDFLNPILNSFLDAGFPYVSIVEGGYLGIHEFAMHYKLTINEHTYEKCSICTPGRTRSGSFKQGLKKIGNSFVQRFKAIQSMVKSIPKLVYEEVKQVKRTGISRRASEE